MTIGFEKKTYPYILANNTVWPKGTNLINCSQPGFTSSDACTFFFRHVKGIPSPKAVVIYLGNCDANATELKKGRYSLYRGLVHALREYLHIKPKPIALKNKLKHFEWNDHYDPLIERAEKPSDYEFNILRIARYCHRHSIRMILIKPIANFLFPAGLGKGNFLFYRYLGLYEKCSSRLSIEDGRFIKALQLHENGEYNNAMTVYKDILDHPSQYFTNSEYPLIVVNNYAMCAAEIGRLDEAEKLLHLLLKERHVRPEIILYNLAQLHKLRKDSDSYKKTIKMAYESDSSLYRIKDSYREALDRVVLRFRGGIDVIDMNEFANSRLFVDHCHLLPDGQKQLAARVLDKLKRAGVAVGYEGADIKNILYNPELSLGNTKEFYQYYKTFAAYSEKDIAREVDVIRVSCAAEGGLSDTNLTMISLSKEMRRAIEYYYKHPCLPSIKDILHFAPQHPSDIGRFPELFLVRHVIPYLRMVERDEAILTRFSDSQGLLRTSSELMSVLPDDIKGLVLSEDPAIDPIFESGRLNRIIDKVQRGLVEHLSAGNKVHERLKTTIFWYFREVLRWGSHSRISMRYDRLLLEYASEALAVASVLDAKLAFGRTKDIITLISHVEEADRIHSKFAGEFYAENDSSRLLKDYDKELLNLADKVKSAMPDLQASLK